MAEVARLLSRSCTTGWADWIHGELWLLPTALVRRRLSLAATMANGLGSTVAYPLPEISVEALDAGQILATHRTNKVIYFDEIAHVRLTSGLTADGVRITTRNGQRHKLLWLPRDPARAILSEVLHRWTEAGFNA